MRKYLLYFLIEFIIIFVVGSLSSAALNIKLDLANQLISAITAAAVISFAMVKFWKPYSPSLKKSKRRVRK